MWLRHLKQKGWMHWLLFALLMTVALSVQANERVYKIALPLVSSLEETRARWQPLADYLNETLSTAYFEISPLDLQQMEESVVAGDVDFLFVNPSVYVKFSYQYGLSSPLATLFNREQGQNISQFSGVVFTRSDQDQIRQLRDLKGLVIAIPSTQSLAAYQMQALELQRRGLDPDSDITVVQMGLPLSNTLEAVLRGEADAGFMRAGVIEQWEREGIIPPGSYRVVEPRQFGGFPWITSTRLYPEWPFAALSHTDPEVVRQVAAALLNLPINSSTASAAGIAGFTIPGDYRGIDWLLRELKLPPFDIIEPVTLKQIWAEWQMIGWLVLFLFAAFLIAIIVTLKRKNHDLAESQLLNSQVTSQLKDNEELLNHAQHVARIGSWDYDIDKQEYHCTEQMRLMFGIPANKPVELNDFMLPVVKEDQSHVSQAWNLALKSGRDYDIDYRVHVGNECRWVHGKLHVLRNTQGRMLKLLGTIQDVTEKIEHEQHIESLAYTDALTKIPSRAWMQEALDKLLQQKKMMLNSAFLLLINIDRFKTINNARGSHFGDSLLCAVGQRIQCFQLGYAEVKVARIAGDEFAILLVSQELTDTPLNETEMLLSNQCQVLFSSPFMIDDEPITVTVSSGVTRFPEANLVLSAEQVFQRASMALTHARLAGGGHLSFYESPMSEAADQRFRLERDLVRAVDQDQLRLFMQPQFNVFDEKVAAELLLRWEHPVLGMISPAEFIPIAEATNLIVELDAWVMNQACQLIGDSAARGIELHLAINISPRHFSKQSFVAWIQSVLERYQVNPKQLILEITEGVFLHNIEDVTDKMRALRDLGLQFSIDDFGTGYSSLAYLKRLPVNEIKIDQSFVQDAPTDPDDAALIDAILAVAEKMQLRVVAEGVETFEQADFLKERSQTIIFQGYLLGRPAPVHEWLDQWQPDENSVDVNHESDQPEIR